MSFLELWKIAPMAWRYALMLAADLIPGGYDDDVPPPVGLAFLNKMERLSLSRLKSRKEWMDFHLHVVSNGTMAHASILAAESFALGYEGPVLHAETELSEAQKAFACGCIEAGYLPSFMSLADPWVQLSSDASSVERLKLSKEGVAELAWHLDGVTSDLVEAGKRFAATMNSLSNLHLN